MTKLKIRTAGESHGKGLLAMVEGFPAGMSVDIDLINAELRRRQGGFGRGDRQRLEEDRVEILTGLWRGQTIGAPITLWVPNKDCRIDTAPDIEHPRPGHVDLTGAVKYRMPIRPMMERASARETAARVAAGALIKQLLQIFGVTVIGFVRSIHKIDVYETEIDRMTPQEIIARRDKSVFFTTQPEQDDELKTLFHQTKERKNSLGGTVEVRVFGVPIGLGSHVQPLRRLDARLAAAVMSVQAIKGVEIGLGFNASHRFGSEVHDPIGYDESLENTRCQGFVRATNHAGGIEGGISNGQPIVVRAAMKPIPTLLSPLPSIHWQTKRPTLSIYERSDVLAVPAASVIVEHVVGIEVARAILEKYGGDCIDELKERLR